MIFYEKKATAMMGGSGLEMGFSSSKIIPEFGLKNE
jgi:hypothetical protein